MIIVLAVLTLLGGCAVYSYQSVPFNIAESSISCSTEEQALNMSTWSQQNEDWLEKLIGSTDGKNDDLDKRVAKLSARLKGEDFSGCRAAYIISKASEGFWMDLPLINQTTGEVTFNPDNEMKEVCLRVYPARWEMTKRGGTSAVIAFDPEADRTCSDLG